MDRIRRRVTGLSVFGMEWKVGAFADDMVVGLGSVADVEALQETVEWYEAHSGAKLNWHKCETMVLGNGLVGGDVIGTIVPAGEVVRYLGIFLSVYGSVLPRLWWERRVAIWGEALKSWGGRHISLAGRVVILNVYWFPKLWYVAYHLDFPAWVVKRLMNLARDWIWAGRRAQISWDTLVEPVLRGGLGLVDFPKRLHCLRAWWLKRAVDLQGGGWVPLMKKVWEMRVTPRGSTGDLLSLVVLNGSQRLRYKGFWWGVVDGAHRIGLRWRGNEGEEVWGPAMWRWDCLLLGGVPLAEFDIGDGVECQRRIGQDLWPSS
jgi:hypothetical protein